MTEHDLLSLFTFHMHFYNTCNNLSEVNKFFTLWCHNQLFTHNFLCDTNRFILLCGQNSLIKLFDNDFSLFYLRCICVNCLTHVNFTVTNLSCFYSPCFICSDYLFASIFILNMKLCKCSCLCTILIRLAIETKDSFIPSVSNCNCDFIFFCKLLCHIIDLILQSVVIACPSRCHTVITYCLSIQCDLIYTMCSCIQTGFLYLFINCKCFSKYRTCCLIFREITCDHLCFEFCLIKNSCLKRTFH